MSQLISVKTLPEDNFTTLILSFEGIKDTGIDITISKRKERCPLCDNYNLVKSLKINSNGSISVPDLKYGWYRVKVEGKDAAAITLKTSLGYQIFRPKYEFFEQTDKVTKIDFGLFNIQKRGTTGCGGFKQSREL